MRGGLSVQSHEQRHGGGGGPDRTAHTGRVESAPIALGRADQGADRGHRVVAHGDRAPHRTEVHLVGVGVGEHGRHHRDRRMHGGPLMRVVEFEAVRRDPVDQRGLLRGRP